MDISTNKLKFKSGFKEILSYFNVSADLLPQAEAENEIRSGVSFKGSQLIILIFAIFVASLGLNTNSIPVIIGAMLISPLMGPIIGVGLGIGIQDFTLVKRGTRNVCMAVIGSIIASAIYFLISPQYEGSSQLLARTSPSIYDVFIAIFGGAAGIVSIACRNKGQVMPGVAIATSLMPPLCTAGYGLATMQMHFFLGALYLFFTNAVFILVATWIGVKVMGYKSIDIVNPSKAKKVKFIVYLLVTFTIGVSVFLTIIMIRKNIFITNASNFVEKEFVFPNTQVFSHKEYVEGNKRYIDVNLIGAALPIDSLQLVMMKKMNNMGLGGTILNIKQGVSIDALSSGKASLNEDEFVRLMERQLQTNQSTIDSLRSVITLNTFFSQQSRVVAPEVKVLFPEIRGIALSQMMATDVSDNLTDTINMAFVNAPGGLTIAQRQKLSEYLEVRLKRKDIHITLNPSFFPWPESQSTPEKDR